jgi:DNA processing protein
VFAVPGAIRNPLAEGCHQLIRAGARLATSASDVLVDLGIPFSEQALAVRRKEPRRASPLDKESEMLLDALGFEPVSINTLVERTGLPSASIASMLLILELGGRVAPHPGGQYCRLS